VSELSGVDAVGVAPGATRVCAPPRPESVKDESIEVDDDAERSFDDSASSPMGIKEDEDTAAGV
jgi:hypothetical protein